jgi:class 3 adenylate cyclase
VSALGEWLSLRLCRPARAAGAKARRTSPFCPHCGTPFAEAKETREQRKVVTVLFCDVTGSTELGETLDPEALRSLLLANFERMKAIVEQKGDLPMVDQARALLQRLSLGFAP